MGLSFEDENRIKKNNGVISQLLNENEGILRGAGFNPPETNYVVSNKNDMIRFPRGYIRTKEYFVKKYALQQIIVDKEKVSNVAYCLQMSDMNNYIMNRFMTYAAIDTMLSKQSYLNVLSVIEALVQGAVINIRKECANCKEHSCQFRITKKDKEHVCSVLKHLNDNGIIHFSAKELTEIEKLFSLRNSIHLISAEYNEMMSNRFSKREYNGAIFLLKRIDEELIKNVVPIYGKCMKVMKIEPQGLIP